MVKWLKAGLFYGNYRITLTNQIDWIFKRLCLLAFCNFRTILQGLEIHRQQVKIFLQQIFIPLELIRK